LGTETIPYEWAFSPIIEDVFAEFGEMEVALLMRGRHFGPPRW